MAAKCEIASAQNTAFNREDYAASAAVWLGAMIVYTLTLGPTITGDDSGQLISAAHTLGITHPPGYPLWCMLGKLFTLIVPFGSIAWRVGLLSAVLGAGAAAVVCLIVIRLAKSRLAGCVAGLALAFSDEFWKQSTIAEVYTLNLFLIALCILILLVWQETRKTSLLYAFAAVYGLGLCNHHTMHFLGPVFGAFILSIEWRGWRCWRTYFAMVGVAFGVWLLVHLYLPLRAMADPAVNYGNPQTWESFWAVVLRKRYAFGFDENPQSIERTVRQFVEVVGMFGRQFTVWLAAAPLLGLYPLW